jgi:hypothetical protein
MRNLMEVSTGKSRVQKPKHEMRGGEKGIKGFSGTAGEGGN